MSSSKTYQQSLADVDSENRHPMLERGSYIPWASRFKRYLNRKRDNRKWLLKALDEGPYVKRIENEAKTVRGTVAVRGGRHVSTRYCSSPRYCSYDGWTTPRVTRGTGVCQSEVL
ncbi:hypothetical protein Tco_1445087 [Tanacetum coccineum]